MVESFLALVAIILMIISIIASFLPIVPGPVIVWAIGVIYAALTGFSSVTWLSIIIMTLLMIAGSTTGLWTQAIGMKTQGTSIMAVLGSLVGGLLGTFLIPVPFLGTLAGIVAGALVFEFARFGEFKKALQSSSVAVSSYVLSIIVEGGIAILILVTFAISLFL